MIVPRQGRREPQCCLALGRLRTPPRGEQRGPAAQHVFRQPLLGVRSLRALCGARPLPLVELEPRPQRQRRGPRPFPLVPGACLRDGAKRRPLPSSRVQATCPEIPCLLLLRWGATSIGRCYPGTDLAKKIRTPPPPK